MTYELKLSGKLLDPYAMETVPAQNPRQVIIQSLQDGVQALALAYKQGTEANPMCADVPVFQRMTAMQKELGAMMLEVNKMRGL